MKIMFDVKKFSFIAYLLGGFGLALLFYFVLHGIPSTFSSTDNRNELAEAEKNYAAGERATTISERKKNFNLALKGFLDLETKNQPTYGNGKLYYNIGNTIYQLGEYPLAVYYYERALALNPRKEDIQNNLSLALQKLDLKTAEVKETPIFHQIFFFHYHFSLPERLTLFFISGILTFLFLSLFIWTRWHWLDAFIAVTAFVTLCLFGSVLYTRYLSPLEGILIRASTLYRDAGDQYAKVTDTPLPPGLKVEVLDIRQEGEWLKILASEGKLGYVKEDAIRIVSP